MAGLTKDNIAIKLAGLYRKAIDQGLKPREFYLTWDDTDEYLNYLNNFIAGLNTYFNYSEKSITPSRLKSNSSYLGVQFVETESDHTYLIAIDENMYRYEVIEDEN